MRVAAKKGLADICKVLLAHNPAVEHDSSLYLAAKNGHLPVIKVLLEHQDISVAEEKLDLRKPMLGALWNGRLDSLRCLFSHDTKIVRLGDKRSDGFSRMELVEYLVYSGRLQISEDARGHLPQSWQDGTLLHLAIEHSDFDLAKYVVQHKSFNSSILERDCWWDVSFRSHNVKTALDLAQFRGHTEIASLLIAHGAINHNIAPRDPPQTGQNPAQSPSPNSDRDHEMQDLSDSDTDIDIDS